MSSSACTHFQISYTAYVPLLIHGVIGWCFLVINDQNLNIMGYSFFYNMFIEPFTDGFWMTLLGILLWSLSLLVAGSILLGFLYLIDSVGLKEKQGNGVVIEKWYEPAHTYTTLVMVGKVSVPQIHHVPDTWKVKIEINNITDNVSFYESDWNALSVNQKVKCTYKNGRIWDSLYITNVSL